LAWSLLLTKVGNGTGKGTSGTLRGNLQTQTASQQRVHSLNKRPVGALCGGITQLANSAFTAPTNRRPVGAIVG